MPTIWNFTMSLSVKTVNKCRPLNLGNTTYRMNKTLRVLQLGKFYPIMGGVEKVMYDLMSGLSERGVPCDMLCALSQGSSRTFSINAHSRLIGCRTWMKVAATMISPDMIFSLRKRCRDYDIIHVHHPDPMACLALFLSGYKGKVILHWHADIEKQKILLKLYSPLQEWLLARADVIIGTTPPYLAESPCLARVRHKMECLPIGIEPVCPAPAAVEEVRKRYPGKKIIFSIGRLVAYKGYKYLIESAHYLDDDYVILIGGSGAMKYDLEAEIETWGVQDKVMLLGRISDKELSAYYGACTLFCLSSVQKTEAFGIVQIEAMSCGKPVVATNIPHSGVSWVNAHGFSGLNVTPCSAKELAGAIMTITRNDDLYQKLAKGARERYQETFTKEKMIDNILEIYRSLWKK